MIDIKLTESNQIYDISYDENGDIEGTDGFDTALLMSVFCEQRAEPEEMPDIMRRSGWIGNFYYNDGYENGSKVWVQIEQGRITNNVLNAIKNAAYNGLKWMLDDNIAQEIIAEISIINRVPQLKINITYDQSIVEERYFKIWRETGK